MSLKPHRLGAGMDIIVLAKHLKNPLYQRHREVLAIFVSKRDENSDFCFIKFSIVAEKLNLSVSLIRRSARYLARKELLEYQKGLYYENGSVAGSGYAATSKGSAVNRLLTGDEE